MRLCRPTTACTWPVDSPSPPHSRSPPVQLNITRLALSYGNLLFIAAIVLISVGMYGAVAEPTHHLP